MQARAVRRCKSNRLSMVLVRVVRIRIPPICCPGTLFLKPPTQVRTLLRGKRIFRNSNKAVGFTVLPTDEDAVDCDVTRVMSEANWQTGSHSQTMRRMKITLMISHKASVNPIRPFVALSPWLRQNRRSMSESIRSDVLGWKYRTPCCTGGSRN